MRAAAAEGETPNAASASDPHAHEPHAGTNAVTYFGVFPHTTCASPCARRSRGENGRDRQRARVSVDAPAPRGGGDGGLRREGGGCAVRGAARTFDEDARHFSRPAAVRRLAAARCPRLTAALVVLASASAAAVLLTAPAAVLLTAPAAVLLPLSAPLRCCSQRRCFSQRSALPSATWTMAATVPQACGRRSCVVRGVWRLASGVWRRLRPSWAGVVAAGGPAPPGSFDQRAAADNASVQAEARRRTRRSYPYRRLHATRPPPPPHPGDMVMGRSGPPRSILSAVGAPRSWWNARLYRARTAGRQRPRTRAGTRSAVVRHTPAASISARAAAMPSGATPAHASSTSVVR